MVVVSPAPPGSLGSPPLSVIQASQPLSCCGALALTLQLTLEHSSLSFCSMADSYSQASAQVPPL